MTRLNIYVGSQRSAQRILASISVWIERHLKLKVNTAKSGTGRPWERQFLGFSIQEDGKIAPAERSIERFRQAVRTHWEACQSVTSGEMVTRWQRWLRGWCNYFGLAQARKRIETLQGWVRRHMRKCFWLRWHDRKGRLNALKRMGAKSYHWATASSRRGAWRIAASPALQAVLSNQMLRRYGLWVPSDIWAA